MDCLDFILNYWIPFLFILRFSDAVELESILEKDIGIEVGTNKWTSCTTHFKTDDGMCKDEFGEDWASTDTWETCGAMLGKRVLCRAVARTNV